MFFQSFDNEQKDVNINEIGTVIVYVVNHISLRFAAIQQLLVNETAQKNMTT
jgi:hypothetical protein